MNSDLQKLMASTAEFDSPDEDDSGMEVGDSERGDYYQMEFRQHKRDYYCHKLGYSKVTEAVLREQVGGLFLLHLSLVLLSYKILLG